MDLGLVHVFLVFALLFWGHFVEAGTLAAGEVIDRRHSSFKHHGISVLIASRNSSTRISGVPSR